ncbi:Fatty acid amide hydrolase [Striga hermonthica]|uniref:Fatty acid amide hydrolase n=1 Tax=Striga hermonthica TaxID=68872 RepID=A0A9N7MH92_STRHE|nr:Fatty acid amide hydrolase [Striga hermonthica]
MCPIFGLIVSEWSALPHASPSPCFFVACTSIFNYLVLTLTGPRRFPSFSAQVCFIFSSHRRRSTVTDREFHRNSTCLLCESENMGKKKVMLPADEVDLATVKYQYEKIEAPHLTGFWLNFFVKLLEAPLIGSLIVSHLKKENKMIEMLRNTVIPEAPMFKPEFPPQEPEAEVVLVNEDGKAEERVELALKLLPDYDPSKSWTADSLLPFRYWKIRDYAYAYKSKLVTPSIVAERFISAMDEFNNKKPPMPLLISYDPELIRKQAAASTRRFEEGNPISVLDGIFVAIKDDIDCCPHPSKGGTTFFHEVRPVKEDAATVARLRSCGVILVGKANMHELGLGTTGNNPNHGTTRNPHAPERYTGGSSSGPAAIVASGLCSAALGTDGGGSVRIPSSLCGVVGLKSTYGRTDMKGSICDSGTVEIIGPLASSVEDALLVYAAILGSSIAERISMKPSLPCLPNLTSHKGPDILGSLRLGKYTEWFNDVFSADITVKCEDVLNRLSEAHGCKTVEIVIPELHEMRTSHLVSIGSESACGLNPDFEDGKRVKFTHDTRTNLALFQSFSASDYVAAQCLRRRQMYYHTEIFKKVDVIVTPTTGMTAPVIPPASLSSGETNFQVTGNLMRFAVTANILGFPAISVPVGYDKQGLPIGLQIIGRPWCEATILRLAVAVEELCGTPKKKPSQFYDMLKGN